MIAVFLSCCLVGSFHLIWLGNRQRRYSRIQLLERQLGLTTSSTEGGFLKIFNKLRFLLSGDFLNPWGTDELVTESLVYARDCRNLAQFRRTQVLSMLFTLIGLLLWLLSYRSVNGNWNSLLAVGLLLLAIPLSGWSVYRLLKDRVAKRNKVIDSQLASILDLLAFSVSAGEPIVLAISRVGKLCSGPVAEMLKEISIELEAGLSVKQCLQKLQQQSSSPAFTRTIRAINTSMERGTPIAQVLRAQANDARSNSAQQLIRQAGKKESTMMIPVVFLILPMIVFIALYPGLSALQIA